MQTITTLPETAPSDIQDAYHHAMYAAGGAVDGVESVFSGRGDGPRTEHLRKAVQCAKRAGLKVASAKRLADAAALARAVRDQAAAHGIDANSGCLFTETYVGRERTALEFIKAFAAMLDMVKGSEPPQVSAPERPIVAARRLYVDLATRREREEVVRAKWTDRELDALKALGRAKLDAGAIFDAATGSDCRPAYNVDHRCAVHFSLRSPQLGGLLGADGVCDLARAH